MDIYLIDQIMKQKYKGSDRILDAGCGEGRNLRWFAGFDYNIWRIDMDLERLRLAKEIFPKLQARLMPAKLSEIPFPDAHFEHIICSAVLHFAEDENHFYKMFSEKEFTWDRTGGDPITQGNRNPLLYKNLGADGIKTGYLAVEKYSLASSVERNGRRLIAVGSGFNTKNDRSRESAKLLTWGLTNFDLVEITKANTPIEDIDVWLGKKDTVKTYIKNDIYKTIPKAKKRLLKVSLNYNGPIQAPIKKDDILGKLKLIFDGELIEEYDLLAYEDVKKLNVFSLLMKSINFLIWGDV